MEENLYVVLLLLTYINCAYFFLSPPLFFPFSYKGHLFSPHVTFSCFILCSRRKGEMCQVSWDRRSSEAPLSGRWWPRLAPAFEGIQSPCWHCVTSPPAWRSWADGHNSAAAPPFERDYNQSLPGWPHHTTDWLNPAQRRRWWARSAQKKTKKKRKCDLNSHFMKLLFFQNPTLVGTIPTQIGCLVLKCHLSSFIIVLYLKKEESKYR